MKKLQKRQRSGRRSEKAEWISFACVKDENRYNCLFGDEGKWQSVNANGRIPAELLINFFAIITMVRSGTNA